MKGENVVVATPTASGKSVCFNLPVLDALSKIARRGLFIYFRPKRSRAIKRKPYAS